MFQSDFEYTIQSKISIKDQFLLDFPIFPDAIKSVLQPKLENLELMVSRLKMIDNHEMLFLLTQWNFCQRYASEFHILAVSRNLYETVLGVRVLNL